MLGARLHKIPRFSIQIDDSTSNHNLLINQAAAKLSNDLLKLLVLLIHQNNYVDQHPKHRESINEDKEPKAINTTTSSMEDASLNSTISMFGYQILQNPQYSQLCWVTSNFKEGPSANISKSQWEDWKFNSCVLHPTSPLDDIQTEENFGMVKGLVAVGLSATRGVYTSLQEVCFDVRAVLTVLVEKVNAKVAAGKDRLRYIQLLSQAASLEDNVYSWAYELQRYNSSLNKFIYIIKLYTFVK